MVLLREISLGLFFFFCIASAASKAEQQRTFACLALASVGQTFKSWSQHPAVCDRQQEHKTKEDRGVLALCTLSEELNLYPSSLSRLLDFPRQIGGTGERFPDPSFLCVISETRTLILRTKGKWASWGRREQPPTSPQEKSQH